MDRILQFLLHDAMRIIVLGDVSYLASVYLSHSCIYMEIAEDIQLFLS